MPGRQRATCSREPKAQGSDSGSRSQETTWSRREEEAISGPDIERREWPGA